MAARFAAQLRESRTLWRADRRSALAALSALRCDGEAPVVGADTIRAVTIEQPISQVHIRNGCSPCLNGFWP